ncbi:MAG: endolytic transglycosylase MltG [Ruminococcaceae bacterium]|nr:endolytic transglycosylase MltG [Oscillospiraceae bacterium]
MSAKKKIVLGVILVIVAVVAYFAITMIMEYTRTTSSNIEVTVQIPKGASEKQIAEILKDNGVIDYELTFRLKMKNSPHRGNLNYGKFVLKKKMCLDDLIEVLARPTELREGITVTIPEGYSAEKIAVLMEEKGLCSKEEFLKELSEGKFNYDFIKDIPEKEGVKYKLQGYLFPSTYIFDKETDASKIINTLLKEFENQYNKVRHMLPDDMTMAEAINRAALIEREAKLDKERETISGVIDNRLDIGMILQIDASVVYAISDGLYNVERVLYKDLEIDSPYNTYKYKGLPAGPICNPGLESIRAAMNPEEHKYLYYHTDTEKNDGSHIFSETFSQHTSK